MFVTQNKFLEKCLGLAALVLSTAWGIALVIHAYAPHGLM